MSNSLNTTSIVGTTGKNLSITTLTAFCGGALWPADLTGQDVLDALDVVGNPESKDKFLLIKGIGSKSCGNTLEADVGAADPRCTSGIVVAVPF